MKARIVSAAKKSDPLLSIGVKTFEKTRIKVVNTLVGHLEQHQSPSCMIWTTTEDGNPAGQKLADGL